MTLRLVLGASAFVALGLGTVACSHGDASSNSNATSGNGAPTYAEQGCDDDGFARVQKSQSTGSEVTICGHVVSVAGDFHTRSGLHKHWRVDVHDQHDPIEIDSNEDLEGTFTVSTGAYVVVRGEYYSDPNGREGIHYTHIDPRGRHAAGFVYAGGKTYQ